MQLLRIDWNVIFTIVNLIVLYLGLRNIFNRTGHESDGSAQAADRRADGGRTPCK